MPQGYTESITYCSPDTNDFKFPRDSTLIQYVNNLLLCSRTLLDSQKDTIYLLQQLAIKRHKVPKDMLQFCLPEVKYLGDFISKDGLLMNPERLRGILSFSLSKTGKLLRGFHGLTENCRIEFQVFH